MHSRPGLSISHFLPHTCTVRHHIRLHLRSRARRFTRITKPHNIKSSVPCAVGTHQIFNARKNPCPSEWCNRRLVLVTTQDAPVCICSAPALRSRHLTSAKKNPTKTEQKSTETFASLLHFSRKSQVCPQNCTGISSDIAREF